MNLLDEARNAPTRVFRHYERGIGQGFTSESHRVEISAEARDALVEVADAADRLYANQRSSLDAWASVRKRDMESVLAALQRLRR